MVWSKDFVYFGSSEFSSQILAGLLKAGIRPVLVVSTLAKPAGRGLAIKQTPVSLLAEQANLKLITVKTLRKGLPQELNLTKTAFGLLAAFGKILPAELLDLYPLGIINVHPSLLPLYRGASPIQSALMAGANETGVSLIKLDEEVDHGPILAQKKIYIGSKITTPELEKELSQLTLVMLLEAIPDYLSGQAKLMPQIHQQATFTKLITKQDGQADFTLSAVVLNNKRRAFTPWPGLWTIWQGRQLKLIETDILSNTDLKPGQVAKIKNELVIGCGDRTALIIKTLQLEGGKAQSADNFVRGYAAILNSFLPS